MNNPEKIDVLICVSRTDIHYMLEFCLKSCIKNFMPLKRIYIVTPVVSEVIGKLKEWSLFSDDIMVLNDSDVLSEEMMKLQGWLKQQLIKLQADQICSSRYVCCLGSDTVILKPVNYHDLFENNKLILYFNRYSIPSIHLHYERKRVEYISTILKIIPKRSFLLGDFIMELMIFDVQYLIGLREYLVQLYGQDPLIAIIPPRCETYLEKAEFGEWTLYSVYILDVLNEHIPIKNSGSKFVIHLHSNNDLKRFRFDCHVAHFVDKSFDIAGLKSHLESVGIS